MTNKHINTFMFDLDNTLYKDTTFFFEKVKVKMNEYIQNLLGVSPEQAAVIRDDYYHQYGTTLTGLRQKYGIDPDDFLAHIDDVELEGLQPDEELIELISGLKGDCYVLTNASDFHAERLLKHLKLDHCFTGVFTLQSANHVPKPNKAYYQQFINQYRINPKNSVFFEDSSHNLVSAADFGFQTVLIRTECDKAMEYHFHDNVHHITDCIKSHLSQYR